MDTNDELLCVADTKLVLGNWFAECVMNGRSLPDFAAMLGMCTAAYGQTRAIYQHLAAGKDAYAQLERGRGPEELCSMEMLDAPPENWEDLVVTTWLAEQATWSLASGFLSHSDRRVAALARKIGEEAYFHMKYASGWFKIFAEDPASLVLVDKSLQQRLPLASDWFGPDEWEDRLFASGMRSKTCAEIRAGFLRNVGEELEKHGIVMPGTSHDTEPGDNWVQRKRRRGDMPKNLFEVVRFKDPALAH